MKEAYQNGKTRWKQNLEVRKAVYEIPRGILAYLHALPHLVGPQPSHEGATTFVGSLHTAPILRGCLVRAKWAEITEIPCLMPVHLTYYLFFTRRLQNLS